MGLDLARHFDVVIGGGSVAARKPDPRPVLAALEGLGAERGSAVMVGDGRNDVLTARAENFLDGRPDLGNTIRRLQALQEAGADVLYAAGLMRSRGGDIAAVVRSVDRPVNVVMGLRGVRLTVPELAEIGVRRVSLGSALSRAALGAFVSAAREIRERGSFTFADQAAPFDELNALFGRPVPWP